MKNSDKKDLSEQSLRELRDNIKRFNIYVIEVSEGKESYTRT